MRLSKKIEGKKGIILIMALWIMTILSVVAVSFAFMMRTEMKMAANYRNGVQAHYLALAGVEHAIAVLRQDTHGTCGSPQTGTVDGKAYYNYEETDSLHEEWFLTFADNYSYDVDTSDFPSWDDHVFTFGKGQYSVHLVDESSMMNINVDYGELVSSLESLWYLLGGNVAATQKAVNIKDHRDWGDATTTYGDPPRTGYEGDGTKDYDFDTIREIQKVTEINVGENPLDDHACDLTVYSKDKNHCMDRDVTMTGTGVSNGERLNINNATLSEAQIIALPVSDDGGLGTLVGTPPLSRAQHILNYRDGDPGADPPVPAHGDFMRVGKVAETYGPGIDEVINDERMEQLADVIKVNDTDDEIKGTININTATYWSLRSYWLVGPTRAKDIIKTRQGEIPDKNGVEKPGEYTYGMEASSTGRTGHGRGEMLNTDGIARLSFDDYSDFVTVRSDRFRIVSTGKVENAAGKVLAARKIEAVIDRHYHDDPSSPGPIEILYWSEKVFED